MADPDPKKSSAVMQAMMKVKKIIIKDIQDAYDKARGDDVKTIQS